MEAKDIKNLKEACKTLGLDYSEFIDTSEEIEKGIGGVDYKSLYENQKEINKNILLAFGGISKSIDTRFNELQKGFDDLNDSLEVFKESPMHQRKSAERVVAIEKAFDGEGKKADLTFDLKNGADLKGLKKYLGNQMTKELEKGISEGFYQKAALMLDANKALTREIIKDLFDRDKILVKQ